MSGITDQERAAIAIQAIVEYELWRRRRRRMISLVTTASVNITAGIILIVLYSDYSTDNTIADDEQAWLIMGIVLLCTGVLCGIAALVAYYKWYSTARVPRREDHISIIGSEHPPAYSEQPAAYRVEQPSRVYGGFENNPSLQPSAPSGFAQDRMAAYNPAPQPQNKGNMPGYTSYQ